MDDWGAIAYDDERKRWQWHSRYVTESVARSSFDYRIQERRTVLLVRMVIPQPAYHRCEPGCACFRETVMEYEPDTRSG
jgi:hypothetical protein